MPRIARRSYLRLELLLPNTFDKLVRFVFGDIIGTRIDQMKRKPCCLLIISSTQHLEIYRFFAGDSAYRCHRYALSIAEKSRISFLGICLCRLFCKHCAIFRKHRRIFCEHCRLSRKGLARKAVELRGMRRPEEKALFCSKKVYYPPLIINLLRIFAAERVCRKRFFSWNMPKQPARP